MLIEQDAVTLFRNAGRDEHGRLRRLRIKIMASSIEITNEIHLWR
jgi:hypothetical protein